MAVPAEQIACIVLAAGRSTRFGAADKLAANWRGRPLLDAALGVLDSLPFAQSIVVCRQGGPDTAWCGFRRVEVPADAVQQSDSLRAGLAELDPQRCSGVLIALGDMPRITPQLIERMLAQFDPADPACVIAASNGRTPSPPALFAKALLPALQALQGDSGARDLLRSATLVETSAEELSDIDRTEDLA
jgi:molybdenum cofactor cytidylyltransferase